MRQVDHDGFKPKQIWFTEAYRKEIQKEQTDIKI